MRAGGKGDTGLVTSEPGARGGAEARGRREEQQAAGAQRAAEPPPGPPRDLGAKFPTKFARPRRLLVGQRSPLMPPPRHLFQAPRNKGGGGPPPHHPRGNLQAPTDSAAAAGAPTRSSSSTSRRAGAIAAQSRQGAQASGRRGRAALLIGGGQPRSAPPLPPASPRGIPRESWAPGALRLPAELETPRDPPPLRTYLGHRPPGAPTRFI